MSNNKSLVYSHLPFEAINPHILEECAQLFSSHYGIWSPQGRHPRERIKLSPSRIQHQCLFDSSRCSLATARTLDGGLVGHAFLCRFPFHDGFANWITQLVVHSDFRHRGIAKKLCSMAWDEKCLAWGIVSSHPFAVRALEKMTGFVCDLKLIAQYAESLVQAAGIPYVHATRLRIAESKSVVDTEYFVDHGQVNQLVSMETDWRLGTLNDGEEYFAFVFRH